MAATADRAGEWESKEEAPGRPRNCAGNRASGNEEKKQRIVETKFWRWHQLWGALAVD